MAKRIKLLILAGIFAISQLALSFSLLSKIGNAESSYLQPFDTGFELITQSQSTGINHGLKQQISYDGRYVAYMSQVPDLVPGDTNGKYDVFVKDIQNDATERVSLAQDGSQFVSDSTTPVMSSSGRYVAFTTTVNTDPATLQVYVRDRLSNTTFLASSNSEGIMADISMNLHSVSDSGKVILRSSSHVSAVIPETDSRNRFFVKDITTDALVHLPFTDPLGEGHEWGLGSANISADGSTVMLSAHDYTTGFSDVRFGGLIHQIIVVHLAEGTTEMVSTYVGSAPSYYIEFMEGGLSRNGRYALFGSYTAYQILDGINATFYMRDLQTGDIVPIDEPPGGRQLNGRVIAGSVSDDGSYVGFSHRANTLDINYYPSPSLNQFYVWDRTSDTSRLIVNGMGGPDGGNFYAPGSNTFVFRTFDNLTSDDVVSGVADIYVTRHGGLSADSPTNKPVSLSWQPAIGASSYKVYRDGVEIGNTTETTFIDNTLSTDGTYSYTYAACNNTGCSDQSVPAEVVYDTTAPVLGESSWSENPLTVGADTTLTTSVTDGLSGVEKGEYFIGTDPGVGNGASLSLGGVLSGNFGADLEVGTYEVGIRAQDKAGNWSGVTTTQLVVKPLDETPPSITYVLDPEANISGWHNSPAALSWSVEDTESPVNGQVGCEDTFIDQEGIFDFNCEATSDGGTASQTATVKYDSTEPTLGVLVWSANPLEVGSTDTTLTVPATDNLSGVVGGEYFIGTDPGEGNATGMTWDGTDLSATALTMFMQPGAYTVGIRTQDAAGNWSTTTYDYLVIYDPAGPLNVTGKKRLVPSVANGDLLPGLTTTSQDDRAVFGFDVTYIAPGIVDQTSEFGFTYETGKKCNSPNPENCHSFVLNATSFDWLGIGGANNSEGTFQGTATLTIDGVDTTVVFRTEVLDGDALSPTEEDHFTLLVYAENANPETDQPLYQVSAGLSNGSDIKIQ